MRIKVTIPVLATAIIIGVLNCAAIMFLLRTITPPEPGSEKYITVTIPEESSLMQTAGILKDKGLIKNKYSFVVRSFTSGIHMKMNTGTYDLSPGMTNDEIIKALVVGDSDRGQTVTVTIPEGSTIGQIASILEKNGVIADKEKFLDICKTTGSFVNSSALEGVDFNSSNRETKYILEGYLFPDTYEFYKNSNPHDVIRKFINNFAKVYGEEYEKRTKELGFTKKDVVTIASIIQKEAMEGDYKKVSAVIYNRLQVNAKLQVDSSIRYVMNEENTITLSSEQYMMESSYNTYTHNGLTPTAICCPGKKAIEAALYPDKKFIRDGYMYFCLTEATSNTMAFSKTYEEHLENVKKYRSSWQAYDNAVSQN